MVGQFLECLLGDIAVDYDGDYFVAGCQLGDYRFFSFLGEGYNPVNFGLYVVKDFGWVGIFFNFDNCYSGPF